VIEDEEDIAELVRFNLEKDGHRVRTSLTGEDGLSAALTDPPHLVVLDLMLPGLDGLELCRRIKADPRTARTRILILTAKGEETDIVVGLELGADDYIVKPFSPRILRARVKAVLRRESQTGGEVPPTKILGLTIDTERYQVKVGGVPVDLTSTEFKILKVLTRRPGWVLTRGQIVEAVKGDDYLVTDRSVDVHITSIRKKLGAVGVAIETVRGVGYRFKEDA
jgi:two-component system phosphate regulon response regulator PhoB